jgi:hypothetical protein
MEVQKPNTLEVAFMSQVTILLSMVQMAMPLLLLATGMQELGVVMIQTTKMGVFQVGVAMPVAVHISMEMDIVPLKQTIVFLLT